jgi:hypothetical protein
MCQSHQGPPFLPAHLLNEPLAAGSTELPITFQLPRLTDPFPSRHTTTAHQADRVLLALGRPGGRTDPAKGNAAE